MKKIELSKRLHKAAEYAVSNRPVLDIGSDHAYLPIYLVQENIAPQAIAGEVVEGPFKNAKSKVKQMGLEKQISIRMGNGLEVLEPSDKVGTIFICGMGGVLISEIIKNGLKQEKLPNEARLVLQPNNAEKQLRQVLVQANYVITEEVILEENNKIYELLIAEYTEEPVKYTSEELLFGPKLMKEQSTIFIKKWTLEIQKLESILEQLDKTSNVEKIKQFREKIQQIEQVIAWQR